MLPEVPKIVIETESEIMATQKRGEEKIGSSRLLQGERDLDIGSLVVTYLYWTLLPYRDSK